MKIISLQKFNSATVFLIVPILLFGALYFFHANALADSTESSGNNCTSKQRGINNNNNCNQQNQSQNQDQTQNNNQEVNISLTQNQTQQIAPVVFARQLPSTGTPIEVWEAIATLAPLGIFLRKKARI